MSASVGGLGCVDPGHARACPRRASVGRRRPIDGRRLNIYRPIYISREQDRPRMSVALRSQGARKRRHPVSGGYARGRATRAKIVAAALEIFGAYGFDGASTRMIADKARVNLPALAYYFGGKRGLYRACAEHIAARIESR